MGDPAGARMIEGARRNRGWLYVLDEDLQFMAGPCDDGGDVPDENEGFVEKAVGHWARHGARTEMMMMVSPRLSARVFPMYGPGGGCTVVYLEPLVLRDER